MFCRQLQAFEHVWKPLHNHEKYTKAVRIPVHGFIRCRPWLWWRMWSKMEWSQRTIAHLFGKSFACQSQGIIPTYCYTKWYVRSPNHWDVRSQWVCMFEDGSFYWIFQCVVPFAQQHPSCLSIMFGHKLLSSFKSNGDDFVHKTGRSYKVLDLIGLLIDLSSNIVPEIYPPYYKHP